MTTNILNLRRKIIFRNSNDSKIYQLMLDGYRKGKEAISWTHEIGYSFSIM